MDPDLLYATMEYWKEFYKRYIKAQKEAGADAIWFGDCNAFNSMVSIPQYSEHIMPITNDLVSYCKKELNIIMIMHNSEMVPRFVPEENMDAFMSSARKLAAYKSILFPYNNILHGYNTTDQQGN